MVHTYRWQPTDGVGLEHLSLDYRIDAIVADSIVIGDCGDGPFGCSYRICCDKDWRVRSVALRVAGGAALAPRRMEQAYTRLAEGRYLDEGPIGDFQAELALDGDGLVLRYPSLFTRLPAS